MMTLLVFPSIDWSDASRVNIQLNKENQQQIIGNKLIDQQLPLLKNEDETNKLSDKEYEKRVIRNYSAKRLARSKVSRARMMPFEKNVFTSHEYDLMLQNTGLENCGIYFKKMEDKYGVNGLFAIGVAMHESARGFKPMRNNNYFGMMKMSFKSKKQNILYFGELLSGRLYKGSGKVTIESINARYAADPMWASRVRAHMVESTFKLND